MFLERRIHSFSSLDSPEAGASRGQGALAVSVWICEAQGGLAPEEGRACPELGHGGIVATKRVKLIKYSGFGMNKILELK